MCIVKDHRNGLAPKSVFLPMLVDGIWMRWVTSGVITILDDIRLTAREYAIEVVFNI